MKVIMLAAGLGKRLKPFTNNTPKPLFKLGKKQTILERMVDMVKRNCKAEICIVTGFMHFEIEKLIQDVNYVHNPFYRFTNSIASLWFAREYLDDDVIIINSDVVIEESLFKEILEITNSATVIIDSSKKYDADYKVATYNNKIVMMSKEIETFSGEYVGITKLSKDSSLRLKKEVENMIANEQLDEWYENALVHMILNDNFELNYYDIPHSQWVEVETAEDLLTAKTIYEKGRGAGNTDLGDICRNR